MNGDTDMEIRKWNSIEALFIECGPSALICMLYRDQSENWLLGNSISYKRTVY